MVVMIYSINFNLLLNNPIWKEKQIIKKIQQIPEIQLDYKVTKIEPIVFFGGLSGAVLEANLTNVERANIFCYSNSKYYHIWVSFNTFYLPYTTECWEDNMRLRYNVQKRISEYKKGVNFRFKGFGGNF
jgi:hypothetical protein